MYKIVLHRDKTVESVLSINNFKTAVDVFTDICESVGYSRAVFVTPSGEPLFSEGIND